MARALVKEPDIVLLDEPTNHLDIDTILWLENLLLGLNVTLVIVSHDRSFIDKLCTRIMELDRGMITSYPGNFSRYLQAKAKALEEEERHNAKFDKKLAQEEVWIRQGIQARRTRNEGRVRALKKMREERRQRRERQGTASISLNQAGQVRQNSDRGEKHLRSIRQQKPSLKIFPAESFAVTKLELLGQMAAANPP